MVMAWLMEKVVVVVVLVVVEMMVVWAAHSHHLLCISQCFVPFYILHSIQCCFFSMFHILFAKFLMLRFAYISIYLFGKFHFLRSSLLLAIIMVHIVFLVDDDATAVKCL